MTAAHCFCRGDPDDPHPDDLPCEVSIHEYCTSNIGRSVIKVLTRNEKLVSAIQKKISDTPYLFSMMFRGYMLSLNTMFILLSS